MRGAQCDACSSHSLLRACESECILAVQLRGGEPSSNLAPVCERRVRAGTANVLCASLAAPPREGAANDELLRLVSGLVGLAISVGEISLVGGRKARLKVVRVGALSAEDVAARMLR